MKRIALIISFCLIFLAGKAQNSFYKTYSLFNNLDVKALDFLENPDGSFLILASDHFENPIVFKCNSKGNLLWSKKYRKGNSNVVFKNIRVKPNQNIVIFGAFYGQFLEFELNSFGDSLASRQAIFNTNQYISGTKVLAHQNGYAIFQTRKSTLLIHPDTATITLLDANLNVFKEFKFSNEWSVVRDFKVLNNDDLLLFYYNKETATNKSRAIIVRMDNQLNKLWEYRDTITYNLSFSISGLLNEKPNGDLFFVNSYSNTINSGGFRVLKIDPQNGNLLWEKRKNYQVAIPPDFSLMSNNHQNGFLLLGNGQVKSDSTNLVLWNFNSSIDSLWFRQFGEMIPAGTLNLQMFHPSKLIETSDGGFAFVGWKFLNNLQSQSLPFIIKTNGNGIISNVENIVPKKPKIKIYPNPNNGEFWLEFEKNQNGMQNIFVYDLLGKQVFSKNINNPQKIEKLNLTALNEGIYIISIQNKEKIFNQKIIISK